MNNHKVRKLVIEDVGDLLTHNEFRILITLIEFDYTGKNRAWLSQKRLAALTGIKTKDAIRKITKRLVEKGLIDISKKERNNCYDWSKLIKTLQTKRAPKTRATSTKAPLTNKHRLRTSANGASNEAGKDASDEAPNYINTIKQGSKEEGTLSKSFSPKKLKGCITDDNGKLRRDFDNWKSFEFLSYFAFCYHKKYRTEYKVINKDKDLKQLKLLREHFDSTEQLAEFIWWSFDKKNTGWEVTVVGQLQTSVNKFFKQKKSSVRGNGEIVIPADFIEWVEVNCPSLKRGGHYKRLRGLQMLSYATDEDPEYAKCVEEAKRRGII